MPEQVRQIIGINLEPGDILGLSGASAAADAINLATWGVPRRGLSHLAIVTPYMLSEGVVVCEATIQEDYPCVYADNCVSGVQAHWPDEWLARQHGRVWHYPIASEVNGRDARILGEWCRLMMGRPYDYWGALHARDVVGGWLLHRVVPEDFGEFFCSEFVPASLRTIDRFSSDNCSAWSPNRFTREWVKTGGCLPPVRIK